MDKIRKLVKLFYILTFAVYGIIIAFLISFGLLAFTMGILWIFVFGDNPWPDWVQNVLAPAVVLGMCVSGAAAGIFRGRKYAVRIMEKDPNLDGIFKTALRRLLLAAFSLILFSVLFMCQSLTYQYREMAASEKERQEKAWAASLKQIDAVTLSQKENNLVINAVVLGKSADQYELSTRLVSTGYVQAPLMELKETIPLKYDRQVFTFEIPFNQLAQAYRDQLINYIPVFKNRFDIDEYITVEAGLKLLETTKSSAKLLKQSQLPENKKTAIASFSFSCQNDACQVVQSPVKSTQEQNSDSQK